MKLIIDDNEIELISPLKEKPKAVVITEEKSGRKEGGNNKTELEKEIIALDAIGNNQKAVAAVHGVTQTEVSIHSRAVDRSNLEGQQTNEELKTVINQRRYNIADKATSRLFETLDLFNPENIESHKLPAAAAALATVVDKIAPADNGNTQNVIFQVFSPRMVKEESFEVIEVSE